MTTVIGECLHWQRFVHLCTLGVVVVGVVVVVVGVVVVVVVGVVVAVAVVVVAVAVAVAVLQHPISPFIKVPSEK